MRALWPDKNALIQLSMCYHRLEMGANAVEKSEGMAPSSHNLKQCP